MEKINRHNYELFFVDYFDKELNELDTQALFEFLELNADLKVEFDSFKNLSIPNDEKILDNKPKIKKHIDETNIEHYIIADLEGELDSNDKKEYTNFIAENSFYASTLARYKKTILPEEVFLFPNKSELKQKNKAIVFWPYISAIAAAVLLFFILNTDKKPQQYQLQALQDILKVKIDSVNNNIGPFQGKAETLTETNNSIAINKVKKKIEKKEVKRTIIPNSSARDSTVTFPKEIELPKLPRNKTFPQIEEQELIQFENNMALVQDKEVRKEENKKTTENIPTLKQTIHNKIKTKLFNDENKENKLINGEYLITATTEKMKNVSFEQTEEKERKKTRFKIGKIEFYRDKGV